MNESEFNQRADDLLVAIEEAIDDADAPVDYESSGGVLTLEFENESQIIINRQTPLKQMWMATRDGGFHFDWDDEAERWVDDSSGEEFFTALSRYASEQAGAPVELLNE